MNPNFSAEMRRLRKRSHLTQTQLAKRAGIAPRTLGYWEAGERLPRTPELLATLMALGATPAERLPLLAMLALPSTRNREVSVASNFSTNFMTEWVNAGDLLRAMRVRQGATQEAVAQKLRLRKATIADWERGKFRPSEENLERLCVLLEVEPEEQAAVTASARAGAERKSPPSPALLEASVVQLDALARSTENPLFDLHALTLKRHLNLLSVQSEKALPLLARVELAHAFWLEYQARREDARRCMTHLLCLMSQEATPEPYWIEALNLASHFETVGKGNYRDGLRFYRDWIPQLPNHMLPFSLCDMALYLAISGEGDQARQFLTEAESLQKRTGSEAERTSFYWQFTEARVSIHTEISIQGFDWMLTNSTNSHEQSIAYTDLIGALIMHNEKREASHILVLAEKSLLLRMSPKVRLRLERYALLCEA